MYVHVYIFNNLKYLVMKMLIIAHVCTLEIASELVVTGTDSADEIDNNPDPETASMSSEEAVGNEGMYNVTFTQQVFK